MKTSLTVGLVLALSIFITHPARALILAITSFQDSFDFGNINRWTVPAGSASFAFLSDGSAECYQGGCLESQGVSSMYQSHPGRGGGAFTLWEKSAPATAPAADIKLCTGDCTSPLGILTFDPLTADGTWHQYYVAWRQGASSLETCMLVDDRDPDHCRWHSTSLPLDTYVDGVLLNASGVPAWFDELQDPPEPPPAGCSQNCNSNVLFLPGIEGTRLYSQDAGSEQKLWEPGSDADASKLALKSDGTSLGAVYAKQGDILDEVCVTLACPNVYKTFMSDMDSLKVQGQIEDWEPIAYDWRLSYDQLLASGNVSGSQISYQTATSSPYIIQELKRLAETSRTGKVTIVAHSMGGLVAKALMERLGPDAPKYIDKVILVASPQLGTAQTVAGLLHGSNLGVPLLMSEAEGRSIGQNMPTAYDLLPSEQYFTYVDDPVVTFDAATLPEWSGAYGAVHSTARLRAFMTDASRIAPSLNDLADPAVSNAGLFDAATTEHTALDAWTPPGGIQVYEIAGWGNDTLSSIAYKKVLTTTCTKSLLGLCLQSATSTELTFDPVHVIDGDGTVLTPSALWSDGASTTQYWVDLNSYNQDHKLITLGGILPYNHNNIFEIPVIEEYIKDVIEGVQPASSKYISASQPSSTNVHRLHFVLHSPLTLGFVDASGNYSGATATSTVLTTPGIEYEHYGDVQWLSIPSGLAGQLVMHGTSSGSFSLDVSETFGDAIESTASFEGVPSSTSTLATLAVDPMQSPTASSTLFVDYDGDGTPDLRLKAQEDSVVTPDLTPPEAAISVDALTHLLSVAGSDESSTTVVSTTTTTTITDTAGNATTLTFKLEESGHEHKGVDDLGEERLYEPEDQKAGVLSRTVRGELLTVQYGPQSPIPLNTSFMYQWGGSTAQTLVTQKIEAPSLWSVHAEFNKAQNQTVLVVKDKKRPAQVSKVSGSVLLKIVTEKGVAKYGW